MTALSQTGTSYKFWDPRIDPFRFWLENSNIAELIPKLASRKSVKRINELKKSACGCVRAVGRIAREDPGPALAHNLHHLFTGKPCWFAIQAKTTR